MQKFKSNTFYCFSAPVMLATFIIEFALAIYLLVTRKQSKTVKLSVTLLILLGTFQLAEYGICEAWGLSSNTWAKIGFVAITFLPPVGLHLVHSIAKQKTTAMIPLAYSFAVVWSLFFMFGSLLQGSVCTGNYIIFNIPEPFEGLYYMYYDITIAISIALAYVYAKKAETKKMAQALRWLIIGYLLFIIPSIIFVMIDSHQGVDSPLPSIMCGFALLLALILTFVVIPQSSEKRPKPKK